MKSALEAKRRGMPNRRSFASVLVVSAASGAVVGWIIRGYDRLVLTVVAAAPVFIVLYLWPEWAFVTIVALTASFYFHFTLPSLAVGSTNFYLPDLLLFFSVISVFLRRVFSPFYELRKTPLNWLVLAFFTMCVIGAFVAMRNGRSFGLAFGYLRYLAYFLLYFPAANLLRNRCTINRFLVSLAVLASMIAIGELLITVYSPFSRLFSGWDTHQGIYGGFARVSPPGDFFVFTVFVCVFSVLLISRSYRPFPLLLLFVVIAMGIGLTFSRALWTVTAMSFGLIFLLSPTKRKVRFLTVSLFSVLLFVGMGSVIAPIGRFGGAINERLSTFVQGNVLLSSSAQYRYVEAQFALKAIARAPIIGHGLGYVYRPPILFERDNLTNLVENCYLSILKDMGGIGLTVFLSLIGVFLARGFTKWRKLHSPLYQAIVLGTSVSMLGLLGMSFQGNIFENDWTVSVYGLMMGLNEAIYALESSGMPPRTTRSASTEFRDIA